MDQWSINVKNTSTHDGSFLLENSIPEKPFSKCGSSRMTAAGISSSSRVSLSIVEIWVSKKKPCGYWSFVVRTTRKNNNNNDSSSLVLSSFLSRGPRHQGNQSSTLVMNMEATSVR